jgi:NAD-dependent DNA ligase
VNKTDSATMGANFGTVAAMLKASEADLSSVPGLGPTKAKRLYNAFSAPLLRLHRMQASATESGDVSQCQGKAAAQVSNDHETEGEAAGQSASHRSLNADDMREWLATQEIIADVDESEDADLEDDFM